MTDAPRAFRHDRRRRWSRDKSRLYGALAAAVLIALTGCRKKEVTAAPPPRPAGPPKISDVDLKSYKPNEAGAIMIVMYHRFNANKPNGELNRTPEQFRKDLDDLYKRGYRPVIVSEFIENRMDVPAGKTPVVLTFDDSLLTQFKIITGSDGQPHIDPDCAIGMMETFHKEHPDWLLKGTFFILPKGDRQPDPFYQPDAVGEKFAYLLKNGYEIGNHTTTHPHLNRLSAERVRWEIATPVRYLKQVAPEVKLSILALPYGLQPRKDARKYLISGEDGSTRYQNKAVVFAAWRPVLSPVTKSKLSIRYTESGKLALFNPYHLERITPNPDPKAGQTFEYWLNYFDDSPGQRYISDGNPQVVAVPKALASTVDAARLKAQGKVLQAYSFTASAGGGALSVESGGGRGGALHVEPKTH